MPYLGHMQPATHQQYGPGYGPDEPPPAAPQTPLRSGRGKVRTGLVLLVAFLTQVVLIAVGDNQWIVDRLNRAHLVAFGRGARQSALVYYWRFTPRAGDTAHLWVGSLALIGTTILVSLVIIAVIVRGPVTFFPAFLGSWMAVAVATMIGGYVRALVIDVPQPDAGNRMTRALFGAFAPGSYAFLAGATLGFVVGLVAALVAVTTRRAPQPVAGVPGVPGVPPYGEPQQYQPGPPWQDRYYGPPGPVSAGPPREDAASTTQFPSLRKDGDSADTGRLPEVGAAAAAGAVAGAAWGRTQDRDQDREQSTTVLPRLPADSAQQQPPPAADERTTSFAAVRDSESARAESESSAGTADQPRTDAASQSPAAPAPQAAPVPPADAPAAPARPEAAQGAQGQPPGGGGYWGAASTQRSESPPPSGGNQPTAQFPRPPDDEDMNVEQHD